MRVLSGFRGLGAIALGFLEGYGAVALLFGKAVYGMRRLPRYGREILNHYRSIATGSVPLIFVTSVFMGFVLGVQIGAQTASSTPTWFEGGVIIRAVLLEMGPIVTGLVLAGRIGSGIAAEIGTMKITEQVDALTIMGIDPVEYLVTTRLTAALLAVPVLIIYFDVIASLAGFVSSHFTIGMTWPEFARGARSAFLPTDVYANLIKAGVTGLIIVLIGCHFGLSAERGAKGVGAATTRAVIWSSVAIAAVDYILSAVLLSIW